MTEPDLDKRGETLGVRLTRREKAHLEEVCGKRGVSFAVLVRNLLRDAEILPAWSVEGDDRTAAAVAASRRHAVRPQAHHYAGLIGRWVDMSRPANAIERDAGAPDRVGMSGLVVEVRDSGGGVAIMTDYGMGFWIGPDGDGWQFRIRTDNPEEDR